MKNIGLYIHIPFCNGKCPYCDFYSVKNTENSMDEYISFLNSKIDSYQNRYIADTVYFGGGTPSLLGTERIVSVLEHIQKSFGNSANEITLEVNPESAEKLDFERLRFHGINRISIGLQSANNNELQILGRKHSAKSASDTVNLVRNSGIDNISLDLMIGISGQTFESLENSILFCAELQVTHISSYILKIEEGTLYYRNRNNLNLPDEDTVCDFYEFMVNKLDEFGYKQYEISNFSKPGMESRHNLKYWKCEEYLGLGASAHSFIDGKRFYYDRSIKNFYLDKVIDDGTGGDEEEYIAMNLRLAEGIRFDRFEKYFGYPFPERYLKNAKKLLGTNLLNIDKFGIRLTAKGFLCSNSIIVEIIS